MIETINERISATESFASKLKDLLGKTANNIETSIASQKESSAKVVAEPYTTSNRDCKGSGILKYASLTVLMIGGVGWLASVALWSKILTFGGIAGLAYSLFGNIPSKRQPQSVRQPRHSVETTMSAIFIADQASALIDALKEVSNLWTDFAESSKFILNQKIKVSSLNISTHERFKLESLIRVPKILSFPLIEYRNILEDACTPDKLKKAAKDVAEKAIVEIDRVTTSQIGVYHEMNVVISETPR